MKLRIKEANKAIIVVDDDKDSHILCNDILFTANGMSLKKIEEVVDKVNNTLTLTEKQVIIAYIEFALGEAYGGGGQFSDINLADTIRSILSKFGLSEQEIKNQFF